MTCMTERRPTPAERARTGAALARIARALRLADAMRRAQLADGTPGEIDAWLRRGSYPYDLDCTSLGDWTLDCYGIHAKGRDAGAAVRDYCQRADRLRREGGAA